MSDRRSGKSRHREDMATYRRALASAHEEVEDDLPGAEGAARRRAHPDPAALVAAATGPSRALWERRATDRDFLAPRVGPPCPRRCGARVRGPWQRGAGGARRGGRALHRVAARDRSGGLGPAVGVYSACVEAAEGYLPAECRAVIAVHTSGPGSLRRSGQPDVAGIALDQVVPAWCGTVGRRVAPLRDPELASIPASLRLVDLFVPVAAVAAGATASLGCPER